MNDLAIQQSIHGMRELSLFAGAGGGYSQQNSLGGERSAPLSVMLTPQQFWRNDKMMDCSKPSLFGLTLQHLTESRGEALLTLFLAAFPAKTLAVQEKAQALKAHEVVCGQKWRASFAKYDPDTHLLKMCQHSLLEDSIESLLTLPRWGMWDATGVWEVEPSIRYVKGRDFGLSLLRPTAQCWKAWTFKNISSLVRKNHADGNIQEQSARCFRKMITPESNEILMQFPAGWTDLKPLVMHKTEI